MAGYSTVAPLINTGNYVNSLSHALGLLYLHSIFPPGTYESTVGVMVKGEGEVCGMAPWPGVRVLQISGFESTGAPVGYPQD